MSVAVPTYKDCEQITFALMREYFNATKSQNERNDLIQESWVAFLETVERYGNKIKSQLHFKRLYRRVFRTRLAAMATSSIKYENWDSEVETEEGAVSIFELTEQRTNLCPEKMVALAELPYDLQEVYAAINYDDNSPRQGTIAQRPTTRDVVKKNMGRDAIGEIMEVLS